VLYRVAQEALTNVVKHAKADHAWVGLRVGHGQVTLGAEPPGRHSSKQRRSRSSPSPMRLVGMAP